jgi:hypothetical protein
MMISYQESASPGPGDPAASFESAKGSNHTAVSLACAILGVCVVYVMVLDWRFPYIHQLPVFDLDYITTVMMMFARNWWIEGPWHMLFSMPYVPLSVETPTPDLRYDMYQSWPPGAVLSLYLVAKVMGSEPSITMVNWLNVAGHGLIALFLALAAWVTANMLRRPKIEGVVLAIVAACLVLFPRGPVFFFSQVYAFDTHVVVYYALLIFVVALEFNASDRASARWYYYFEIVILIWGLYVDWLFYFVFALWLALRMLGTWTQDGRPLRRKEAVALTATPLVTFAIFLLWRFVTPGSIAAKQGVMASIQDLVWKFIYRVGDTDDHPVSAAKFFGSFYDAHRYFFWDTAPILIGGAFVAGLGLLAVLFAMSRSDAAARRIYFGLFSIFLLSIVPAYVQMIVFKQHTFIHPWSIAKVVVPLAMIPGVLLPLLTVTVLQRLQLALIGWRWSRAWRLASSLGVLAFAVWIGSEAWPDRAPYLLGRIDPQGPVPWLAIHDNTSYYDVVFAPDFETVPFGIEAAVAGKLVYQAGSFADIDRKVVSLCSPFNVVVVRKGEAQADVFDGRTPDQVIHAGGLTLVRFQNYRAAAKSCPKA